jgi:hypothetical protein
MGLIQTGLRTKQVLGKVLTICKKCNQAETSKFYDLEGDTMPTGSFTKRCKCGTTVYRFHNILTNPDPNNKESYYTKAFIPTSQFDKDYKKKDLLEKSGFKKMPNGKYQL